MIHVAPCSCELHVRIRELEAALKKARMQRNQLETHQTPYVLELQARAEKAEARVAELSLNRRDGLDDAPVTIRPCRDPECNRPLPHQAHTTYPEPAPASEGHEREAD